MAADERRRGDGHSAAGAGEGSARRTERESSDSSGRANQRGSTSSATNDTEKLQKVLAGTGLGSRRELEKWIAQGRVQVNGAIAAIGDRVRVEDSITVDGRAVNIKARSRRPRVLRYHKPAGEVCTRRDPEGRPTIFEQLPPIRGRRWIAVGRLDVNTTGLLLLTDDGDLAHRLMHPSNEMEREYAVRVYGSLSKDTFASLTSGVELEDGPAQFATLTDAGGEGRNHWYHVTVREGRNRLVRRLWESQDVQVSRLTRVRFGPVELPRTVRAGRWDNLPVPEVIELMKATGMRVDPQRSQRSQAPGDRRPKVARNRANAPNTRRRPS
ncbi:MAG: 23S rRNA pseudouridine2605 synthase [Gammaproteobacteria bacterium]|jgi:23S rRNA pseudouridine2605 synthase